MGNCQWRFSEWSSAGNLFCFSRWFSQILPLIAADKTNYFKANFHFCGHLREIFPVFSVNGEWWKFGHFAVSEAQCKPDQHTISYPLFSYPLFSDPFFSYPLLVKYPKCLYQAVLVSFFNTSFSTCISFKMAMQASFNGNSSNFAIWKTTSESIPL